MKPLQALERLTKIHTHDEFKECYDIIETALKSSEMEHTLRVRLENINYELVREKEANEKKLKAVEIIKENCFLKEHMGDVCLVSKRYITDKQKIDLLKELFE